MGVAHRIDAPVYVVHKRCPVHAPRTPWWLMPGLILAGAVTSGLVSGALDWLWLTPLPAGTAGLASGIAVMLGGAQVALYTLVELDRGRPVVDVPDRVVRDPDQACQFVAQFVLRGRHRLVRRRSRTGLPRA